MTLRKKPAPVYLAFVEVVRARARNPDVLILATGSTIEQVWERLAPIRRMNPKAKARLRMGFAEGDAARTLREGGIA
ncbi:MAG: hypothetical protein ABSE66_09955 [Thermoplasmata archaeon]